MRSRLQSLALTGHYQVLQDLQGHPALRVQPAAQADSDHQAQQAHLVQTAHQGHRVQTLRAQLLLEKAMATVLWGARLGLLVIQVPQARLDLLVLTGELLVFLGHLVYQAQQPPPMVQEELQDLLVRLARLVYQASRSCQVRLVCLGSPVQSVCLAQHGKLP